MANLQLQIIDVSMKDNQNCKYTQQQKTFRMRNFGEELLAALYLLFNLLFNILTNVTKLILKRITKDRIINSHLSILEPSFVVHSYQ